MANTERFSINKDFLDKLRFESGVKDSSQLIHEALSLLRWAISQSQEGRILVTCDKYGESIQKVDLKSLTKVDFADNAPSPSKIQVEIAEPKHETVEVNVQGFKGPEPPSKEKLVE